MYVFGSVHTLNYHIAISDMPLPNIIEVCKQDLFSPVAELESKYNVITVARLMRLRDEYLWVLANPDFADRQFIDEFNGRTGLRNSQLYGDLNIIKQVIPALSSASRDWHRHKANEMLIETYQLAKRRKDTKTMERAASSYAKYNRVDLEDEQTMPFDLIVVQPFMVTHDPSVLGIKPIEDVENVIKNLLEKYTKESVDIDDVEYEEADLEEEELWKPKNKDTLLKDPDDESVNIDSPSEAVSL